MGHNFSLREGLISRGEMQDGWYNIPPQCAHPALQIGTGTVHHVFFFCLYSVCIINILVLHQDEYMLRKVECISIYISSVHINVYISENHLKISTVVLHPGRDTPKSYPF